MAKITINRNTIGKADRSAASRSGTRSSRNGSSSRPRTARSTDSRRRGERGADRSGRDNDRGRGREDERQSSKGGGAKKGDFTWMIALGVGAVLILLILIIVAASSASGGKKSRGNASAPKRSTTAQSTQRRPNQPIRESELGGLTYAEWCAKTQPKELKDRKTRVTQHESKTTRSP